MKIIINTILVLLLSLTINKSYAGSVYTKYGLTWAPGRVERMYHIQAAKHRNTWRCLPGYSFINPYAFDDPRTGWTQGLRHPKYHIVAAALEGYFVPMPGYQFVPGHGLKAIWCPNLRYDELKVISTSTPGVFRPYDGYRFVDATKGIAVTSINNDDSDWFSAALAAVEAFIGGLIDYVFPGNPVSQFLYSQAMSNGLKIILPKNHVM